MTPLASPPSPFRQVPDDRPGPGDRAVSLAEALKEIGRDPVVRACIIDALRAYEQGADHRAIDVRDQVTGPIVDALHADVATLRKELGNGLLFEFPYRSKIARDFVMSVPEKPDHVWEPQTTRLLLHLCREVTDAIVGGAYFGDQAIPVADALRGRGTCHAFEPDADEAALLERNARLNGLTNLRVRTIGLWSDTVSRLAFTGDDALASPVAADEGVPVTTIDAYAAEAGMKRLGLIMLDVEGAELRILQGAEQVLRRDTPHVVFEIHRSYVDWSEGLGRTEIVRYLERLGYTIFAIRDFQSNVDLAGRPIELVPLETAFLDGPPHGFNMVAVQDRSLLEGENFLVVPNVSPKLLRHRDPRLHHPVGGLP